MELIRRFGRALLVASLAAVVVGSDDHGQRQHPQLPVLGYVTSWNPRGKELVEEYRDRFDIVSPVWYTLYTSKNETEMYEVSHQTTEDEDMEWYQRLQQGPKPLRIAPRFLLNAGLEDYRNLISNQTRSARLLDLILEVVNEKSFDGVVFESEVSHAMRGFLGDLSAALWKDNKILIVVVPPAVDNTGVVNDLSEQTVSELVDIVDYFSIVTYDMYGNHGQEYTTPFPVGGQLFPAQQHRRVRVPGPNASFSWIQTNMMAFWRARSMRNEMMQGDGFQMSDRFDKKESGQLLMGVPLYSYKYPVQTVDKQKGLVLQLDEKTEHEFVTLRGQGQAVGMPEIQELIDNHHPQLHTEYEGDPVHYFDYFEEDGRWRVFVPTPESVSAVLKDIYGVALWEVGHASAELLSVL
ncbi:hypothetical protein BX600DRAFT_447134 [Xylariales sp. PMI_506]|nr:hypothetical protein BX600DRAFT_447134 [Xylariales sp. PMI_506]